MVSGESKPSGLATWPHPSVASKPPTVLPGRPGTIQRATDGTTAVGWCGCLITKKCSTSCKQLDYHGSHFCFGSFRYLQISFGSEVLPLSNWDYHSMVRALKKGKRTRFTGWWLTNHLEKWWSSSMGRLTSHIWNGHIKKISVKPPASQVYHYVHLRSSIYLGKL